jgi:hypothetical protein
MPRNVFIAVRFLICNLLAAGVACRAGTDNLTAQVWRLFDGGVAARRSQPWLTGSIARGSEQVHGLPAPRR